MHDELVDACARLLRTRYVFPDKAQTAATLLEAIHRPHPTADAQEYLHLAVVAQEDARAPLRHSIER